MDNTLNIEAIRSLIKTLESNIADFEEKYDCKIDLLPQLPKNVEYGCNLQGIKIHVSKLGG